MSRQERLQEVPRVDDGILPSQQNVAFPATLERLLVSGNESLPSGQQNDWNKNKSIALLQFYGEQDETDTEEEDNSRSLARRLRLARKLGVSQTQLNFAQLTL